MRNNNLHAKILIPVWGDEYLEKFLYSYASHIFSEPNVNILENFKTYEFVFLTSKPLKSSIEQFFVNKKINFSLQLIDDLLTCDKYGIVLTLAYTRGILNSNTKQQETVFIFFNADFVISNNVFEFIVDRVNSGYNATLCPSMRCIEEDVIDILGADRSQKTLVTICQQHMHPTMAANILNQNIVYNAHNLAFHLKINATELLTISLNPFMLYIKPEIDLVSAHGFCDFTFVKLMVPSDNYYFVTNSDEIFILEPTPKNKEQTFVKFEDKEKHLSNWLSLIMMQHRLQYKKFVHYMHIGSTKSNVKCYETVIKKFFDTSMSSLPKKYFDTFSQVYSHPFWVFSVKQAIENGELSQELQELDVPDLYAKYPMVYKQEIERQNLIKSIDQRTLNLKLQKVINKADYDRSYVIVVSDLPMGYNFKQNNKKNRLYDVRIFLNTFDPVKEFAISPKFIVVFNVSHIVFDFYRNKIFKFALDNINKFKVIVEINYSNSCPTSSIGYLHSVLNSGGIIKININANKIESEKFSIHMLKKLIKYKYLPFIRKIIRTYLHVVMSLLKTICSTNMINKLRSILGPGLKKMENLIIEHNLNDPPIRKCGLKIYFENPMEQ